MFLKNYTSDVPVHQTIQRIEKVLLDCGVTGIMKEYGLNQKVVAVTFQIEGGPNGKNLIRFPADEDKATEALWRDYVGTDTANLNAKGDAYKWGPKRKRRADFVDQGARTAWRIIKDWIEVQMSMIQLQQADLMQVFLPYLYDGRRTYYQALKESNFAGLLQEKTE
jgi:hypothetical protein